MKVMSSVSSASFGGAWVRAYSPDSAMGVGVSLVEVVEFTVLITVWVSQE